MFGGKSFKQAIVLRSDLGMGKGKLAAQASHAAIQAFEEALEKAPDAVRVWKEGGCEKIVLKVGSERELGEVFRQAKAKKLPCALIRDAGHTQIPAGSATAVAIGPAEERVVDGITGKLRLL